MIDNHSQHLPSQAEFSQLLNKLQQSGLELINFETIKDTRYKIAGLVVLDCLLDISDEVVPEQRTDIANHLRKVLSIEKPSLEVNSSFLVIAAGAIGRFARNANATEIEYLQNYYVGASLKWLAETKSDCHRFAGIHVLIQLAGNLPTVIFAKRKAVFTALWEVICDRSSLVREAAAVALSTALQLVSQREAVGEYVRAAIKQVLSGLMAAATEKTLGALYIVDILVDGYVVPASDLNMSLRAAGERLPEFLWKIFQKRDSRDTDTRKKVMQLLPKLSSSFSNAFLARNEFSGSGNFLTIALKYYLESIKMRRCHQTAYLCLGKLFTAMAPSLRNLDISSDVFPMIDEGFTAGQFCVEALQCLGMVVSVSISCRKVIVPDTIESMFLGGLSVELVEVLKILMKHVPLMRPHIQLGLRLHIANLLSRTSVIVDDGQYARAQSRVFSSAPTPAQ